MARFSIGIHTATTLTSTILMHHCMDQMLTHSLADYFLPNTGILEKILREANSPWLDFVDEQENEK